MFMIPKLKLRTGDELPAVGLGLWKINNSEVPSLVQSAVEIGYRHFDCACDYGNEAEAGSGLQRCLQEKMCKRDDLWVTSKLWNTYHRAEHVRSACEKTLSDLKLDYLDLYLIHFPIALKFVAFEQRYPPGWFHDPDAEHPRMEPDRVPIRETWEAMQDLVAAGLVKNIGVCNFNISLLRDLMSYAEILPAVLQIESHPLLTQEKLLRYCRESGIAVTAFSPLGSQSYVSIGMAEESDSLLTNEVVTEIAARQGKSPAQILMKWGVQRGTAIVPKTSRVERLKENLSLFDFELSSEEMLVISALNRNRRYNDPGVFCEAAFNTFFPIYE